MPNIKIDHLEVLAYAILSEIFLAWLPTPTLIALTHVLSEGLEKRFLALRLLNQR